MCLSWAFTSFHNFSWSAWHRYAVVIATVMFVTGQFLLLFFFYSFCLIESKIKKNQPLKYCESMYKMNSKQWTVEQFLYRPHQVFAWIVTKHKFIMKFTWSKWDYHFIHLTLIWWAWCLISIYIPYGIFIAVHALIFVLAVTWNVLLKWFIDRSWKLRLRQFYILHAA